MSFYSIARGRSTHGVEPVHILRIVRPTRWRCFQCSFRLAILASLEIGIDQVILRVELVAGRVVFPGRGYRDEVGINGFLPQAEPGEDVRGHVKSVWRVRRDRGITSRRVQGPRRQRWIVVGVDDVVGYAGVLWLFDK